MKFKDINFDETIHYIFADEKWISKIGIAILMLLASFLIAPALILMGYDIELVRMRARGEVNLLPNWDKWRQYLKDGFRFLLGFWKIYLMLLGFYLLMYLIPALAILSEAAGFSEVVSGILFIFMIPVQILVWGVFMLTSVCLGLLSPYFMVSFARDGSSVNFYNIPEIKAFVKENMEFLLIFGALLYGVGFISAIGLYIPIIGWAVIFIIRFMYDNVIGQFMAHKAIQPYHSKIY